MLRSIFQLFDHPRLLFAAAILCVPVLFYLARFFFDDFASFNRDIGADSESGRFAWFIGTPLEAYDLEGRIVAFIGCYILVVLAAYQFLEKLGLLFHLVRDS
jgi:hypothetical protein